MPNPWTPTKATRARTGVVPDVLCKGLEPMAGSKDGVSMALLCWGCNEGA
ncbi:hypothetical protein StoSoilB3_32820 [Arthrobacter sp. StoSoilB3]|nr:hypothetical protein StoSoilB3_32820 [Arthrobacter sp. StoSoilB3]GGV24081.1 hypothetical protein GCM10010212_07260 [Paenarthrobacter nicotinovorans]